MAKRGRPKIIREKTDHGTKELQMRRVKDSTIEPLDLCLKRELIDVYQHEAGLRLRWLYTLRFGSPDVGAYQFDRAGRDCMRQDNEAWIFARYNEYEIAISDLERIGARKIICNLCIFNIRPAFLMPYKKSLNQYAAHNINRNLIKFQEGLDILADSLGKKNVQREPGIIS